VVSTAMGAFASSSRPDCEGGGEGGRVVCVAGSVVGAVASAVFAAEGSMADAVSVVSYSFSP
jgi:hypothetical protein